MSRKEGSAGRWLASKQIGIADDRRQHIVEIMRHAAGELADRLHFLRLREIILERALFGGVERIDVAPAPSRSSDAEMNSRADRSPASATSIGGASVCEPAAAANTAPPPRGRAPEHRNKSSGRRRRQPASKPRA